MSRNNELENIIQSIFEASYLKRIKRSGTNLLLGVPDSESIPEHTFYACLWALVLSHLNSKLDKAILLAMCLIHDLEEVRTGDLNLINKIYHPNNLETKAFSDMWKGSKLGKTLSKIQYERIQGKSLEAIYASDCDYLSELLLEKEYYEKGVKEAKEWMNFTYKRLKTILGKKIARKINRTRMTKWWEEIKNKIRKKHKVKPVKYA